MARLNRISQLFVNVMESTCFTYNFRTCTDKMLKMKLTIFFLVKIRHILDIALLYHWFFVLSYDIHCILFYFLIENKVFNNLFSCRT
jgi:hypothetical protein